MEAFVEDLNRSREKHRPEKYKDFREILANVAAHPNRRYIILKSIILNNLFGVDIMEEAVEICKLRLFLKPAAQVEPDNTANNQGERLLAEQTRPTSLSPTDGAYPGLVVTRVGKDAPSRLLALGNCSLLGSSSVALLCSADCPGHAILAAHDQAARWRDEGRCVVSGFHSSVEKDCLRILLRGRQPIVVCPARSLERMRLPTDLKEPLAEGRLLLLSPFASTDSRVTTALATQRNRLVAALADEIVFAYAKPGGHLDELRQVATGWKVPCRVLTASKDP